MSDGVLLTGATGFVGMELLARYLERTDRRVYALVRGSERARRHSSAGAHAALAVRRRSSLRASASWPCVATSHAPTSALVRRRDQLAERVSEVVHGAASVSFELGLEDLRQVNVEGTRRVLEFAERADARGGLRRFSYISTAYVAGEHAGCFSEDELDVGQSFRNAYEQSKFEAEWLVTRARRRLPVTVLRPSIIVGERDSGWTQSFNVLYWPLRAFARGAYTALPARRDAPVDVVPVDYVADAIFALSQAREAEGATFHLTAGAHTSSVGELVELASTFFERPAPRLIEPSLYRRVVHPLLVRAARDERRPPGAPAQRGVLPVLRGEGPLRRSSLAVWRFAGPASRPTPLHAYFDRLVEFALAADWGRRQLPRASAAVSATHSSVERIRASRARQRKRASVGAGGMTSARLSALDASFLAVETPTAHMHVGWVATFSRSRRRATAGLHRAS